MCNGKSTTNGQFSIAMLNYQRSIHNSHGICQLGVFTNIIPFLLYMSKSFVKAIFIAMLVHWRVYGGVLNQAFYGDNGDTMDNGM